MPLPTGRQRHLWHTPHDTNISVSQDPVAKMKIFIYHQDTVTTSQEYYLYTLYKQDGQYTCSKSDIRLKSNVITKNLCKFIKTRYT